MLVFRCCHQCPAFATTCPCFAVTRTVHLTSNLEILERDGDTVKIRFNWQTNSHRYHKTQSFFGVSFYTLDCSGEQPLITGKKVVLKILGNFRWPRNRKLSD